MSEEAVNNLLRIIYFRNNSIEVPEVNDCFEAIVQDDFDKLGAGDVIWMRESFSPRGAYVKVTVKNIRNEPNGKYLTYTGEPVPFGEDGLPGERDGLLPWHGMCKLVNPDKLIDLVGQYKNQITSCRQP